MTNKTPLIVLFGGTSDERRVSVASGQNIANALPEAKLWFLSPGGTIHECRREHVLAHERPFERDFVPDSPARFRNLKEALADAPTRRHAFLLALHGGEGEDGTLQKDFEAAKVAFTGSGSRASALAFDKVAAKRLAEKNGMRTAQEARVRTSRLDEARATLTSMLQKHGALILKPVANGSSIGLFTVRQPKDIDSVLPKLGALGDVDYLCETFIKGRELTIGVVDLPARTTALPPSEARTEANRDFDYEGKYLGIGVTEITPAEITPAQTQAAQNLALTMHRALGCEGYSRTDAILVDDGIVYLETNTLPGLTRASFIPQQLAVAKIPFAEFLEAQLALALRRAGN